MHAYAHLLRNRCSPFIKTLTRTKYPLYSEYLPNSSQLTYRVLQFYSNLPKSPKFGEQLGLNAQFDKLTRQTKKQENQKVRSSLLVIGIFVCVIGIGISLGLLNQEQQHWILLTLHYYYACIKDDEMVEVVKKLRKYQRQYFNDRPYTKKQINKMIGGIINRGCCQLTEDCMLVLLEILSANIQNLASKKTKITPQKEYVYLKSEQIYKGYLQYLILNSTAIRQITKANKGQQLIAIIEYLAEYATLQTVFLAALTLRTVASYQTVQRETISRIKEQMGRQLSDYKHKISDAKAKIYKVDQQQKSLDSKQKIASKILTNPYLYNCQIHEQWATKIEDICGQLLTNKNK